MSSIFSVSNLFNNINSKSDNSTNSSLDKSKGGILTFGGGATHPLLSFRSWGLTNDNKSKIESKLRFTNNFKEIKK